MALSAGEGVVVAACGLEVLVWCCREIWVGLCGNRTREVLVPEALCPLQELEVVLHLALDEHLDGDGAVDLVLAEYIAEDLEIIQVGVIGSCVELDAGHWHID